MLINWFPVDFEPKAFSLPTFNYECYQDSTKAMQNELKQFVCYRPRNETGTAQSKVIVINGPNSLGDQSTVEYDLSKYPEVASRILKLNLADYMRRRGAIAYSDNYALYVHQPVDSHPVGLQIYSGVKIRTHQPEPGGQNGIVVSWDVTCGFIKSLAEDELRNVSSNLSVILRYHASDSIRVPDSIKKYRNKYLGRVENIRSEHEIEVVTKHGDSIVVPSQLLFLETSPATLYELERRLRKKLPLRRIQELSFVITREGRRNPNVLKERFKAIEKSLSPRAEESLLVPLRIFGGGNLFIDLKASRVK